MQLHEHSYSNLQYTKHGSNMANSKWSQWVSEQSAIKKQKIVPCLVSWKKEIDTHAELALPAGWDNRFKAKKSGGTKEVPSGLI